MSKETTHDTAVHRIAWDGFSFLTPADWNLSMYDLKTRGSSLRMEDDDAMRLEFDWSRPTRDVDSARLLKGYRKRSRVLAGKAESVEEIANLPDGWIAFLYAMPDRRRLAIAFWLPPGQRFLGYLRLHIGNVGPRKARRTLETIVNSAALHDEARIPWEVYDLRFSLDRDFALVSTAFEAGSKMMAFEWRLRRLFLWRISVAEVLLRDRSAAEAACTLLNKFKGMRGATFSAVGPDRIESKRRYAIAPFEDIGRWCFLYRAAVTHLPGENALLLAAFSYRRATDLDFLRAALQCSPDAFMEALTA